MSGPGEWAEVPPEMPIRCTVLGGNGERKRLRVEPWIEFLDPDDPPPRRLRFLRPPRYRPSRPLVFLLGWLGGTWSVVLLDIFAR
jgi:hypothetical protein